MKTDLAGDSSIVFVVDDDAALREALDSLIRSVGLHVETFRTAEEFLRREMPKSPACLVLDVRLPAQSGPDLQRELLESSRRIPIIFITGHGDIQMGVRAMKLGAVEFLTKPFREEDLLSAIHAALAHDLATLREQGILADLRKRYLTLTPRERSVMTLLVRGFLNKQIAAELGTAEITVKIQRANVMKKMAAGSFADLVRMSERLEYSSSRS